MLVKEKLEQAVAILNEYDTDCWITFVRESGIMRDPMMDFVCPANMTWHSAFIVTRSGETYAIIGQMEKPTIDDLGVYDHVIGYIEGISKPLLDVLGGIQPSTIALNYSEASEVCDGLTHGMYMTLEKMLSGIGLAERIVSAEKIASSIKARKTAAEIERMKRAIDHTLEIFSLAADFIRPGRTEREIADFMRREVERRGLQFAWEPSHCPAVFTGPDTAGAHYRPTDRRVERGHVLNMDFGVKFEEYASDLQRTFYVLEEGEEKAPAEVIRGFNTIMESIERARQALAPGVQGVEIDRIAREFLVSRGYEEFPHGLGHQVGRFAHDGTALLGPAWEKYANKPFERIEEGMVFTLEPRLTVPGRGIVTIEEMVFVRRDGAEFLSRPQTELMLIG